MPNLLDSSTAVDPVQYSYLEFLASEEQARQEKVLQFRDYYNGLHSTQLTDRQRAFLEIRRGQEFNVNYCTIPVDALAERLSITGFAVEGQERIFQAWWDDNHADSLQGQVHTAAIRDGDAFVLVEWDNENQRPALSLELSRAGGVGMWICYDQETSKPVYAAKQWTIDRGTGVGKMRRRNVYYPDRIEKYFSHNDVWGGNWQRYDDGSGQWPRWWTDNGAENGKPLGIPVFHFKHNDQGYTTGQSALEDVVPLQNALNKAIIDLLAAADTTAFRIYWMLGDDPSNLRIGPGAWVWSQIPHNAPDGGVSLGYFPGENLDYLIRLKDSFALEIARVTRTPLSYFQISGDRPAEGTLKQEESGLVAKAHKAQVDFGNVWEQVLAMCRRLWNVFGDATLIEGYTELDESVPITVYWKDAQTRNEREVLETLKIKREALRIPLEVLWREAGYSADEVEEMKASPEYSAMLAGLELTVALNGQMNEASNG